MPDQTEHDQGAMRKETGRVKSPCSCSAASLALGALGRLMAMAATPGLAQGAISTGQPVPLMLEKNVTKVFKTGFLLHLPQGYGKDPAQRWPVIVFLHGSGESGTDLEKVKVHGPPKLIAQGKDLPFVVVSPQAPPLPHRGWNIETLDALLDDVLAKYATDPDRVYLTGLSMGGYGTWAWATVHPERFAAIAPICGGGQARAGARALKNMPTWVFHGAKDPVVPIKESQDMVDALKSAGAMNVRFTIYPEADHDSWTVTYENAELFNWFLAHSRNTP